MTLACVTGGAGFIGSHVVRKLLATGTRVRVLDDLSTGRHDNLPDGVELIVGSVADPDACARAVHDCVQVFHLAAIADVQASWEMPARTYEVNTLGTMTLLDKASRAGVSRFVFSSTSSLYGEGAGYNPEYTHLIPTTPYGCSKLSAEMAVRYAGLAGGKLKTVSLRYFNVYGPRQRPGGGYAAVVPAFVSAVQKGESLRIDGTGYQIRDFIYAEDVAEANIAASAALPRVTGMAYNIGTGTGTTIRRVAEIVSEAAGVPLRMRFAEMRKGDVAESIGPFSLARNDIGWSPQKSFEQGIRETVAAWK